MAEMSPRAATVAKYASLSIFGLGFLDSVIKRGLDPLMGVSSDVALPLWLALLLMSVGGAGFLFLAFVRQRTAA